MDSDNMIIIIAAIVVFLLQLLFCFKVRPVILKFFPVVLCIGATVAFYASAKAIEGLEALGYVVLMILGFISLGACLLAWIIYGIATARRKSKAKKLNT
ncbi:MAG: hypothetical protein J6V09_02005 [Clostridia bacterium]|nr:hypothetical protein [Clostridia bacterium]